MGVGEELGRRGHEVTVVSPHSYKKVPPGVTDIVIESDFVALATKMTDEMLTAENPPLPPITEVAPSQVNVVPLSSSVAARWLGSASPVTEQRTTTPP